MGQDIRTPEELAERHNSRVDSHEKDRKLREASHAESRKRAHKVDAWEDLRKWWAARGESEIGPLIEKAREYGGARRANDLAEIGRAMVQSGSPFPHDALPGGYETEEGQAYLAELGIYFYITGKMARWTAAVSEGRMVSDDTLHDIGIYVRMVQRIRDVGGWPV